MVTAVARFVRISSFSSLMWVGSLVRTKNDFKYGSKIDLRLLDIDAMFVSTTLCTSLWLRSSRISDFATRCTSLRGATWWYSCATIITTDAFRLCSSGFVCRSRNRRSGSTQYTFAFSRLLSSSLDSEPSL